MTAPSRRINPDIMNRDSFVPFHSNFMMVRNVMETALSSHIRAMSVLIRRSVRRIRCLRGNRTARNLSTVINTRFDMEKLEEAMKMLAQSSLPSHVSALYVVRLTILNAATAKPTSTSDIARLSSSLSNVFLLLHRNISTASMVFKMTMMIESAT